jgi:uncharacterized protein (TIGR00251 family)
MIIHVKVKPNSGKKGMESFGDNRHLVYLKEPPENGRANIELINFLAKQFVTPANRIRIKSGLNSYNKVIEIR